MTTTNTENEVGQTKSEEKHCGIIMPIATMDSYTAEHWQEVKSIIIEATKQVEGIKFKTEIVSNSDGEIDIIHKRIIQNLYNADIVVCDISGRNPNVMFELGMRLTFDKPTIIIKDNATDFIFDTGSIEHLQYPKDLRFKQIVEFQKELARRIKITYEKSKSDPNYSTFLGNFGEYKVPALKQEDISDVNQFILEELTNLRKEVGNIKTKSASSTIENIYSGELNILNNTISDYIYATQDARNPKEIVHDDSFKDFLMLNELSIYNYEISTMLNMLNSAQSKILSKKVKRAGSRV